ncbi:GntR family transcriptional regulator [Streptomyces sp. NPDC059740]|uniref:GntR family transcriptional regulator n=1 Tax=Streptomyces sp. NPDC059740 TaxID=3346926 RepID=UPI00365ED81D
MQDRLRAHTVCTAMRDDIVSGALPQGSRLIEELLAGRYGVSRVPVREALRTLASEGFVTTRRHAGAVVAHPSAQEAADLLDLWASVQPLGAARAASRRTPAHLNVLRGLVRLGREQARHGHADDLRRLNTWLYGTLAQACGTPTLTDLLVQLHRKIDWMYTVDPELLPDPPPRQERRRPGTSATAYRALASWEEAAAVVDAVARTDAARARSLMACHLQRTLPAHRLRRPAVRTGKHPVNTERSGS